MNHAHLPRNKTKIQPKSFKKKNSKGYENSGNVLENKRGLKKKKEEMKEKNYRAV